MGSLKRKDAPANKSASKVARAAADEPPAKRARPDIPSRSRDDQTVSKSERTSGNVATPPVVSRLKEEEPLFPRGGGSVLSPLEHKQIQIQAKKDVLFEEESGSAGKRADKSAKKKLRPKTKSSAPAETAQAADVVKIESLNFKRLVKGSLVLGQISEINPHEIVLSLPNNLSGHVPITAISDQFTQKLESKMVMDAEGSDDDDSSGNGDAGTDLSSMFSVGQYLRAYVMSTSAETSSAPAKPRRRIELSLYPEHANSGLSDSDVVENCTVMGSILSVEDHGYVVELGLDNSELRGFLSKKEADEKLSSGQLEVGAVHLFLVTGKSSNGKIVQVTTQVRKLGSLKNFPSSAQTVSAFLPGTAIDVLVTDVSSRGVVGKVIGHLDVTADVVHSGSGPNYVKLESAFKVGSKVKARVICTFPAADRPKLGISFLDHVTGLKQQLASVKHKGEKPLPLAVLPSSSTVERCVVRKVEPDIGLFVDVGVEGVPGFVHISRIKDGKVEALYEASGPYKTGSVHRGRVIGYNAIDGIFLLSLEKSVLDQPYLRIQDVPVGEVVNVTIEKLVIKENGVSGLIVKLAEGVTGFVPEMHLADVRLQHPEKKFKEGLKVKARVLSTDPIKHQLRLTLKKTLVNAEAKPIKDFDEAAVGMQVPGTIVKIKSIGAFVQFYGRLRGFLPISEMSEAFIRDPNEHFRVGQVVSVHVIDVSPEGRRLVVSCKDPSAFGIEKQRALQKLELGDIVSAKVTEKSEDDIFVELVDSSLKAVLPSTHLTDKSPSNNKSALKRIHVGQTLSELVVLEKDETRRAIVLSQKPILVKASKDGQLPAKIEDVQKGALVRGFVRNITATAVFVQFAGRLTALLPKSLMPADVQGQDRFGMRLCQSVLVRIHSIDDQRLLAALPDFKAKDSPKEDKPRYRREPISNAVDPTITSTDDIFMGKITKARVVSVKKTQLNVALADGIQGRIDVSEVFDSWDEITDPKDPLQKFAPKQILDVRVIGIHDARNHRFLPFSHRTSHSVLELSAKPSSLRDEGEYKPLSLDDVRVESSWLGFVNNVESNWLWVNLSPTVRGRIRAVEASDDSSLRKDLAGNFPFGSALRTRVLAVEPSNGRLDLSARSALPKENLSWDEVEQDTVMHARVTKVTDRQVIIQLSDSVSGPVHLVDLGDDYDQANPLRHSKNDIIRVAVVSVDKRNKKVRLSTRESRVLNSSLPVKDREITSISQVEPGAIIRGFVRSVSDKGLFVSLGGDVTALVKIKDLSDSFLKEWKDHFQVDQLVKGRVQRVDPSLGHVELSLKTSVLDKNYVPPPGLADFKRGQVVTGKVCRVVDFGVFIAVDNSANVRGLCHKSEMADKPVKDPSKLYKEGDVVKALVLSIDEPNKKISFGLKPSYFNDADSDDEDMDDGDGAPLDSDSDEDKEEPSEDEDMEDIDSVVLFTGADEGDSGEDNDEDGVVSDQGDADIPGGSAARGSLPGLDAGGFNWAGGRPDEEEAESGQEENDEPEKKHKKRRKPEIQIDRTGEMDVQGPQTAGDFERLLLGQPNSSSLWIAYMAFQMQVSELSKAREVAERAIGTINVREETEKLNVWIAYLNLEVAYGTDETVNEVFKQACQLNDEQEVHERLASICIQSGKHEKAEELFQAMVKKFGSKSPEVWTNYAHFLYTSLGSPERGRALLSRAMKSLESHTHIALTRKFAALEFRCRTGEPERGRTVFEGLLATYPKKFDLWNQLLDLEISVAKADPAVIRDVFERGTKVKGLKPRQAKAWFQRWAKWEETNGDTKSRARVSARAKEWASLAEASKARKTEGDQGRGEE